MVQTFRLGYASKTLGFPEGRIRSIMAKSVTTERLREVILDNLIALDATLDYCAKNNIKMFRIGSDIIPFGSSPLNQLDWASLFAQQLHALGKKAARYKIRLSMHPGQYTVLNSPSGEVAERARADIAYHVSFLDALQLPFDAKVVLHLGGAYGNKEESLTRFERRYRSLDTRIRTRLVIENDDKIYTAEDALSVSKACGMPVVFDVLHHELNNHKVGRAERELIKAAGQTWTQRDGNQKIHYSQQAHDKRSGSHSRTIEADSWIAFQKSLDDLNPDIMLEVKDKNASTIKCQLLAKPGSISALEQEWARYKYTVLEHDQHLYQEIRQLLKDKSTYPALEFYRIVEHALYRPYSSGSALNALQHVWGYVSDRATNKEKLNFERSVRRFTTNPSKDSLARSKKLLFTLSQRYDQDYLLHSYYFDL